MRVTQATRASRVTSKATKRRHSSTATRKVTIAEVAEPFKVHLFETDLGWMGALGREGMLCQLTIGGDSPGVVFDRLAPNCRDEAIETAWCAKLARQLQAYSRGKSVTFADVPLALDGFTPFQVRVMEGCRSVAWGQTISYGELADVAGCPGAARAVGNTMARNRFPIVIPCHRVLHSGGRIGGFTAPNGISLKRRMLGLEGLTAK
jgi:methylated-DNA-[protein]-cysteine S-methyltransferase